jgi:poly-gamma-glutamate synthesis protein (capsule biosynthesis protein)
VVNGVVVAHLSYTFSFNGVHVPESDLWRSNLIDPARIIADATAERAVGAEYVIVSLHFGREGSSTPNDQQRWVAAALTASGVVDLVVGHHAHVLQPFGLGNLISNMPTSPAWPAATQDGAIVLVSVARGTDGALATATPTVVPTWVEHGSYVVHPVLTDLADPSISDGLRGELERSLARTARVVGAYIAPPPSS